jgi:amidase
VNESDYLAHDALGLAGLVHAGKIAPRELVEAAIRRIERLNPRLNAVVHTMYEQARREADASAGAGVFGGVPFLLKDLLAWYAGEPITNGSRLFRGFVAPGDSETVKRFRATGAIVVGKTNTPEFGLTPFCESELLGIARNPWDTTRTAGGSSGGSGAAVAAGFVPIASGGDGGGSLRIPASCNGVFAIKPTRGRVPTGPVQGELWHGATAEHVLSRSVRDSAAMLDAIAGDDPGSPYTAIPPARPFLDELARAPRALRVGVTTHPFLGREVHPECVAAVDDARALLESLGHQTIDVALPIDREAFNRSFVTMICAEVAADLRDAQRLLGRTPRRTELEFTTWGLAVLGGALRGGDVSHTLRELQRAARKIGQFFTTLDVLLTPTVASPPFIIGALQPTALERSLLTALGVLRAGRVMKALGVLEQMADKIFDWIPFTPLFNVTGQPAMSIPIHWTDGNLPVGVQVVGRYGDEATLFGLAGQLEAARPWRDRWPPLAAPQ